MEPEFFDPESFPYKEFLAVQEERNRFIFEWAKGLRPGEVPVLIYPSWDMWDDSTCRDRELFLRWNLWGMVTSSEWTSDGVFPHLQPWYGVGIYATAFGCRYIWEGNNPPQTRHIYTSASEVANISTPHPSDSQDMQEVLDRIRWYRKVTHDQLPICLTDTQSPNDTASLILEVNEFLTVSTFEPERLRRFMNAITELILSFSEIQMEAIGPNLSLPGHQMICHPAWSGISVSDDNMAMLSPRAYEVGALPYNSRIAQHFDGIALHSCGRIAHNIPVQLRIPKLQQMECSACIIARDSDPCPNTPELLRDGYRDSGVIAKVRINKEEIELLDRLLAPDFKCAVAVSGVETREESERVYQQFKDRINRITTAWSDQRPAGQNLCKKAKDNLKG